jgi:hypothetical protein
MLRQSELGILFNAPQNIIDDNSDLQVVNSYDSLKDIIIKLLDGEQ